MGTCIHTHINALQLSHFSLNVYATNGTTAQGSPHCLSRCSQRRGRVSVTLTFHYTELTFQSVSALLEELHIAWGITHGVKYRKLHLGTLQCHMRGMLLFLNVWNSFSLLLFYIDHYPYILKYFFLQNLTFFGAECICLTDYLSLTCLTPVMKG